MVFLLLKALITLAQLYLEVQVRVKINIKAGWNNIAVTIDDTGGGN